MFLSGVPFREYQTPALGGSIVICEASTVGAGEVVAARVTVPAAAIGNAASSTTGIHVENLTTGGSTTTQEWHPTKARIFVINGTGMGDALSVTASKPIPKPSTTTIKKNQIFRLES